MHEQFGVAADSDFFDWMPDIDPRFFIAPELGIMHGYPLRPAPAARFEPSRKLALAYKSELPRSAS